MGWDGAELAVGDVLSRAAAVVVIAVVRSICSWGKVRKRGYPASHSHMVPA